MLKKLYYDYIYFTIFVNIKKNPRIINMFFIIKILLMLFRKKAAF